MNFHVAFPDLSLNLQPERESDDINIEASVLSLSDCISVNSEQEEILFFCSSSSEESDMVSAFLKSAISAQKLYRTVSSKCSCGAALMYGSNNVETIRGICVYRHRGQSSLATQSLINVAMEMGYLRHFSVSCIQKGSKWRFKILEKDSKSNDIISDKWYRLSDNLDGSSDPAFCQSRLFSSSDLCSVYHSYKDTRDILKKVPV